MSPKPNPAHTAYIQQKVKHAPYPQLLSFEIAAMDRGSAVITMTAEQKHLQPYGIVHGGVTASLIDTATFWAGYYSTPADKGLVNVDLKLNYLQPVLLGQLVCTGREIRAGRQLIYTEARLETVDGKLLAHGTSTLMVVDGIKMPPNPDEPPKYLG